ncbi:hypothetical protein, partial [Komagataeibacter sp. SM21]|uniref:hypothetical protein n=1 Tax=Komagataeibacter sp. SM21 TaxID=3242899 RepID=UPI003527347B
SRASRSSTSKNPACFMIHTPINARKMESQSRPQYQRVFRTLQVYLGDIHHSAHILDWIYQMSEKTWVTNDDLANLVKAFLDIFGRGVCGDGANNTINPEAVLSQRYGIDFDV